MMCRRNATVIGFGLMVGLDCCSWWAGLDLDPLLATSDAAVGDFCSCWPFPPCLLNSLEYTAGLDAAVICCAVSLGPAVACRLLNTKLEFPPSLLHWIVLVFAGFGGLFGAELRLCFFPGVLLLLKESVLSWLYPDGVMLSLEKLDLYFSGLLPFCPGLKLDPECVGYVALRDAFV
ncbi:hypothetical protein Nepgr_023200 [Nepenthes gracilis]|uniref:Uncharacterized protein n=1 Tax=Nepenthes gracilis TaxID=150966 RepID=A0AAD3XXP0_NEPGR|nr:hypothetical protein Nepgr_023200 [Nepenthes gracilis]